MRNNTFRQIVLAAIVTVVVLGSLIIGLNYLRNARNKNTSSTQNPPRVSVLCPVKGGLCQNLLELTIHGKFIGFRNIIPNNTPIYAVFDGDSQATTVTPQKAVSKNHILVRLTSSDKNLVAVYHYTGQTPQKTSFKKGEIITQASDEPFQNNIDKTNFIFSILDKDGLPIPAADISFINL